MGDKIKPVRLQSMSSQLGEDLAIRSCLPVAFFMLLKANGYLPPDLEPDQFCFGLDRDKLTTPTADWSRPALSRWLRKKYNAPIVSWWLSGEADLAAMKTAGYIETTQEIEFFQTKVKGKTLPELVQAGYPVIVTMKPGFGGTDSADVHAVIIDEWNEHSVTVIDPDARNSRTAFAPDEVLGHLSLQGAVSIVLPRKTS